ncbi:leucine-rich repeat domain-containing protein [Brachyspira sp. SAP_772]|uniref:leucine-rich repeat domain-containing protein n=1 Tax=Brachyspira sp. SAP_772 TaxID=2608385 RepID=UPI0012F49360|nr:leucine-rich repeat domain-containing protein [Brachyspira sp. SAP_772]
MYKKIVLLVLLCFLFTISCSSPNNPNSGNQSNNGGTTPPTTSPTEEELIAKYGIDISQADAEISKQIEANLKAYYTEMGSYRVIFTGTPKDYSNNKSLYELTLEAAVNVNTSMNIEMDISNIDFKDGIVPTGMFSGAVVDGSENIFISFKFPENKITTIGVRAFESLYNTKEITIPNSVTTIESEAFYLSSSIEKLTLGKNVKTIGDQAFLYTQGIKELVIPDSVTSIGVGAFSGSFIETLKLSSSLETIGDSAFDSTSITELTIPASVKSIGITAFAFSQQLTTVTYLGATPDAINNNSDVFIMCDSLKTLIVPNATNPNDNGWKTFLGGTFNTVTK